MATPSIQTYSRERGLTIRDATQTFMQVVVLRHISLPKARLIGETALVLGHGNPRFSEDVDLTQVPDSNLLKPGLLKAARELEGWFEKPVLLKPPKEGKGTWVLLFRPGRSGSLRLHIDSQKYPAETTHPIVIQFPSLPIFICEAMGLEEIMAEKVVALAYRRYLGGRDLFDLWFHWLRSDDWLQRFTFIRELIDRKLESRSLSPDDFLASLRSRLLVAGRLERARMEWRRYLPHDFQRPSVEKEIVASCRRLVERIT